MTGFEPATTRSQSDHSTRLNYIPMLVGRVGFEPTKPTLMGMGGFGPPKA